MLDLCARISSRSRRSLMWFRSLCLNSAVLLKNSLDDILGHTVAAQFLYTYIMWCKLRAAFRRLPDCRTLKHTVTTYPNTACKSNTECGQIHTLSPAKGKLQSSYLGTKAAFVIASCKLGRCLRSMASSYVLRFFLIGFSAGETVGSEPAVAPASWVVSGVLTPAPGPATVRVVGAGVDATVAILMEKKLRPSPRARLAPAPLLQKNRTCANWQKNMQ